MPPREYHVIPSGLDLSLFKPLSRVQARRQLGWEQEIPLVLFSGSPSDPRKRYALAQQVVEMACVKFPGIRLVSLEAVPHTQVPIYLNACDALLSTSMHEGSPNMVKEALACNLPVVSTDVGDVRQLAGKISGCFVCIDDSPESLASCLVKVLANGKRVSARETVIGLDERKLSKRVIELYHGSVAREYFIDQSLRWFLVARDGVPALLSGTRMGQSRALRYDCGGIIFPFAFSFASGKWYGYRRVY